MTAWPSPNDLYAIRKTFSDEFKLDGSKVVRAELIEQKTGRVLCDLTPDDIGTGAEREGEALWSPDSKRVACLSIDLPAQPGHLFSTPRPPLQRKQTTVYQLAGDSFMRVDLPLGQAPGHENDPELKRAVAGHIYTEPVKWQKSNVLILQRHEYYSVMKPIEHPPWNRSTTWDGSIRSRPRSPRTEKERSSGSSVRIVKPYLLEQITTQRRDRA